MVAGHVPVTLGSTGSRRADVDGFPAEEGETFPFGDVEGLR